MTEITFLHTSDWQLGMTRWFLDDDAQARFDAARLAAIKKLGQTALEHGCAFIVVAGDVFDANSLERRTLARALDTLSELPVPVYLLPGNHDPLTADSVFYSTTDIAGVTVLSDSKPVSVAPGVEIVGAPLLSKRATTDLVSAAIEPLAPYDGVRILVGHGQVASRGDIKPDLIDLARVETALNDGTLTYVALGDTHSTESLGTTGRVWFSGSPEVTDFHDHATAGGGESNSGNALVVTATENSVDVSEIPIGTWTFDALDWELLSSDDVDAFLGTLKDYPNKPCTAIKYGLRGTLDVPTMQRLEQGLDDLEPVFASLKPRERLMDLVLAPQPEDLAELSIAGYAGAALDELIDSSDPAADSAVRLMFRLAKGA